MVHLLLRRRAHIQRALQDHALPAVSRDTVKDRGPCSSPSLPHTQALLSELDFGDIDRVLSQP